MGETSKLVFLNCLFSGYVSTLKQLAITKTDINLWPSELLQDWVMLFVTNYS